MYLGICSPLINWIEGFLKNKIRVVQINECLSKISFVHSGLPQGSHLGPTRFFIFVNSLSAQLDHCFYLLFADDLEIYSLNNIFLKLLRSEIFNKSDINMIPMQ